MENQKLELAKQYFEAYPQERAVYISADNQVFLQKNQHDGANHQRSIDPKTPLLMVTRKEVYPLDPNIEEDNADTDADIMAKVDDEANLSADALVDSTDSADDVDDHPNATWTNAQIIDWLKANGVEAKGTKAELLAEVEAVLLGGTEGSDNK